MSLNALMVLDTDPIIIHGITWKHVFNPMWGFGPLLKGQRVNFLISLSWSLLLDGRFKAMLTFYTLYRQAFPEHNITVLCNEQPEVDLLCQYGMDAVLANSNALLDYNLYRPLQGEKQYDAVINSRLDRWKRHILARKVDRLALITYGFLKTEEEASYLRYLRRNFPQAYFPNYDEDNVYHWLEAEKVAEIYSQSHTGLILSAGEGACFAACEYLLSGLPVVSTENVGGRNAFLHPDFSRIVEPSQENVREAVHDLMARDLDPAAIREAAIERIEYFRTSFIAAWQSVYDREGVAKDARAEWNRLYRNKMFVPLKDHEVAGYFEEQGLCVAEEYRQPKA